MNLIFIPRREFLCLLLDGNTTFKAGSNLCSSLLHKIIRQSPCPRIYTDSVVCDSATMTGTELEVLARFFRDIFCMLVIYRVEGLSYEGSLLQPKPTHHLEKHHCWSYAKLGQYEMVKSQITPILWFLCSSCYIR